MKPSLIAALLSAALTGLFAYTSFTKLLDFTRFRAVLSASPLIAKGAGALAMLLIAAELAAALLLIFPRTRLVGLSASLVLLVLITSYLGYMVLYAPYLPCSCGGVIASLSWKGHLLLNAALLGLTGWGLVAEARHQTSTHWPIGLTPPETRN